MSFILRFFSYKNSGKTVLGIACDIIWCFCKLYPTVDTVLPGSQGNFPWRQAAEALHLLQ